LIHNSNEYPDPQTGTAIQKFVTPGEEIFIRVDASSITSTRDILGYTAEKRQCLFADEKVAYNGKYTRSECLLNCKIRSVKALCDCIPFQMSIFETSTNPTKVCTLQHVSCLNKYKSKRYNFFKKVN
jgi:amiloride-sensitive sodium channel